MLQVKYMAHSGCNWVQGQSCSVRFDVCQVWTLKVVSPIHHEWGRLGSCVGTGVRIQESCSAVFLHASKSLRCVIVIPHKSKVRSKSLGMTSLQAVVRRLTWRELRSWMVQACLLHDASKTPEQLWVCWDTSDTVYFVNCHKTGARVFKSGAFLGASLGWSCLSFSLCSGSNHRKCDGRKWYQEAHLCKFIQPMIIATQRKKSALDMLFIESWCRFATFIHIIIVYNCYI